MNYLKLAALSGALALLSGCATDTLNNTAGKATKYEDVSSVGRVSGVGIESQDVSSMTDQMMRDMLTSPILAGRTTPPRIIIDAQYFTNESTSRINTNLITDRLRLNLNRAAAGKMVFVGREHAQMVESERQLKRDGVVDSGTIRTTAATFGADFRLVGRITSLDAVDTRTGEVSRSHLIGFEMIDLESGAIVWGAPYEFKKTAQDNVLYR